jgi:hypothetical protein
LKTGLLTLGLAKSYVLGAIAAAAPILEPRDDMLLLDVERLVCEKGVPLRTNLKSVQCDYGSLVIESRRSG